MDISGSLVVFQAGAEVKSIKLPTDSSTVQILGLPVDATVDVTKDLISQLGYAVNESLIKINLAAKGHSSIATVNFNDPDTASAVVDKFDKKFRDVGKNKL